MGGVWLIQALLISSWLSLSQTHDVTGPGLSCLRSSHTGGQKLVAFLRKDASAGARLVLLLYLTRWTEDARLVSCEIHSHPGVTEGYRAFCDGSQSEEIPRRFNVSALLSPDAPCARAAPRAPERGARRRRAWIFPGTLWCGSGSKADGYEQLGMFERADRCCREHDHCSHIIPAFTVNYGVFNSNFFTVSHCECDRRFRHCLLGMNDSISSMVGYSFFNILKVPCFELKQLKRCTQMYWWGMCKVAKEAPYAAFKSPVPFNSSDLASNYVQTDGKNLTSGEEQHLSEPQRKQLKSKHRCGLRDPARGDTFYYRGTKGRGCKRHQKLSRPGSSQVPTTPRTHTTTQAVRDQTLTPKKTRSGKKKSMGKGFAALSQKKDNSLKVPTSPDHRMSSTTPSGVSPLTQRLKLQPNPTSTVKEENKSTKRRKNIQKRRKCCGSSPSARSDPSQFHRTSCRKQKTASRNSTVTLSKTKRKGSPVSQMKRKGTHVKKTTERPNQNTSSALPTPITTEKTTASLYKDVEPQKQLGFCILSNKTSQQPSTGTTSENLHVKKSPDHIYELRNLTDIQLQCRSLKHLDDCKFKIPPLEKKYNLQNVESKTAYHCDCTRRLAVQIQSFKQPSVPSSLLADFVSQQCFTLPKETKCKRKRRCSEGFTKAFDLHQALKKLKGKDTSERGISANDRRKRTPVRLYKRCLKLQMKMDIMAQLK